MLGFSPLTDKIMTNFNVLRHRKKYICCGDFVGPLSLRWRCVPNRSVLRPTRKQNINKKHPARGRFSFIWWPWSDSNRHSLLNLILSQARLPIPPRGQKHKPFFMRPVSLQPFLPGGHCDSPCVQVFLQVPQVCQPFFQWLS